MGGRKNQKFVPVNCAAIPENLLEAELFGSEKGAFSGAAGRRIGKIEEANGGTLFLDEIGEMEAGLCAKLLRVLQEKEIERLGSNRRKWKHRPAWQAWGLSKISDLLLSSASRPIISSVAKSWTKRESNHFSPWRKA